MNFFYYFIRYTICRNLNRLFKPKNMLIIGIVLLVVFLLLKNESQAAYYGDFTYSDPNSLLALQYESVINDFAANLQTLNNTGAYNDIISDLKNRNYGYYIFYGRDYGLSSVNGMSYDQRYINIAFFDMSNLQLDTTPYDSYFTIDNVDVKTFQSIKIYCIYPDSSVSTETSHTIYIPSALFNYNSAVITALITDESGETIQQIISSIEEQNELIEEQNDYMQQQPQSSDFSTSDLPSDSGVTDVTTDGLNNIFTLFYNNMTREPNGSDVVEVNIPFTSKVFYIPYNYTATYVPSAIKSIISMFWYYVGGVFIIRDIFKKIEKLKSGEIENVETDNIKGDLL